MSKTEPIAPKVEEKKADEAKEKRFKKVKPLKKEGEDKKKESKPKAKAKTDSKKAAEKEKKGVLYTIDCTLPVKDKVFQAKELVQYFSDKIKVKGKTKSLGKNVTITCDDGKKIHVNAASQTTLAKRYLKYLAKKFLKKQEIRDYLRLVAPSKTGYEFKYFKMESGE